MRRRRAAPSGTPVHWKYVCGVNNAIAVAARESTDMPPCSTNRSAFFPQRVLARRFDQKRVLRPRPLHDLGKFARRFQAKEIDRAGGVRRAVIR